MGSPGNSVAVKISTDIATVSKGDVTTLAHVTLTDSEVT